jgi:cold shock CspA family protein
MSNIKINTIKRLLSLTQNRCAFPDCNQRLVVGESFVGEICHISASNSGGPRYNVELDDQGRDSFENLIILCPTHHTLIDSNEEEYSRERLIAFKRQHENSSKEPFVVNDRLLAKIANMSVVAFLGYTLGSILARPNPNEKSEGIQHKLGTRPISRNLDKTIPPDFGKEQRGTVKWFNPTKGFGFIKPDSGDNDVFMHVSAVNASGYSLLNEGDVVMFVIALDRRTGKTSAVSIRKI